MSIHTTAVSILRVVKEEMIELSYKDRLSHIRKLPKIARDQAVERATKIYHEELALLDKVHGLSTQSETEFV